MPLRRREPTVSARVDAETLSEVAAGLRRVLGEVERGELTAGSGEVARLEGATQAIEAIAKMARRQNSYIN